MGSSTKAMHHPDKTKKKKKNKTKHKAPPKGKKRKKNSYSLGNSFSVTKTNDCTNCATTRSWTYENSLASSLIT